MPTIGEIFFAIRYPDAQLQPYNAPYDFDWRGTPVEVKDCIKRTRGRFVIKPRNHEVLCAASGYYYFVLKKKLNSGREVVSDCKFVPANMVSIDEDRIRVETHVKHFNYTATKEVFDLHWREVFEGCLWGWKG